MFSHLEYSMEKTTCSICGDEAKPFSRGNIPHHKRTKRHVKKQKELMDTLTYDEVIKFDRIINLIPTDDLKRALEKIKLDNN